MITAKEVLISKIPKDGILIPGQMKWIIEAMEEYAQQFINQPSEEKMYDLAIAQFTGFTYSKDIIDLIESMGLTEKEWERCKRTGDIDFLKPEDKTEIDEYFLSEELNKEK